VAVDLSRVQAFCLLCSTSLIRSHTMNPQLTPIPSSDSYIASVPPPAPPVPTSAVPDTEERLPFTVRLVHNEADLRKAVEIRHLAYARHMPELAAGLKTPEAVDSQPGVILVLAESRVDGTPLGSLRIHTSEHAPLPIEQSIELPAPLANLPRAQVSRLGIAQGVVGRLVKIALIKASFMYCEQTGIKWAVVAARSPLDRQYAQLHFEDIYPEAGYIPLPHMNHVPHRVMGFEIDTGEARWQQAQHPLLRFFRHTRHPDIQLSGVPHPLRPRVPASDTPLPTQRPSAHKRIAGLHAQ